MKLFTYSSNNSGGDWWLSDEDWKALEAGGWKVDWQPSGKRWLGALATNATKEFESEEDAIADWEKILPDQNFHAKGCSCCGRPHNIYDF